jgi:GGDEF domain-containing protein
MREGPRAQRFSRSVVPNDEREQYGALFDPVTGLPQWALLVDRTEVALARALRVSCKVAVCVLDDVQTDSDATPDVEHFVAQLRGNLRSDDTIGRIGDRTFVVVCNNIGREKDAGMVAQRLLENVDVECRVGVVLSRGGDDASSLLTTAVKQAMRTTPAE